MTILWAGFEELNSTYRGEGLLEMGVRLAPFDKTFTFCLCVLFS
jgi:hypothetical protein